MKNSFIISEKDDLFDKYRVFFFESASRMRPVWGLFLDFWGSKWLLYVVKIGRKLPLGKKFTPMVIIRNQAGCKKMEQIQDLVILAWCTGCPMGLLIPVLKFYTIGFTPPLHIIKFLVHNNFESQNIEQKDVWNGWWKQELPRSHPDYFA